MPRNYNEPKRLRGKRVGNRNNRKQKAIESAKDETPLCPRCVVAVSGHRCHLCGLLM